MSNAQSKIHLDHARVTHINDLTFRWWSDAYLRPKIWNKNSKQHMFMQQQSALWVSLTHWISFHLLSTLCCCLQSTEQPLECGHLVSVTGAGPGLLQWPRPWQPLAWARQTLTLPPPGPGSVTVWCNQSRMLIAHLSPGPDAARPRYQSPDSWFASRPIITTWHVAAFSQHCDKTRQG